MDSAPRRDEAESDVQCILWSAGLASIRRFHHQPYWEQEGAAADRASRVEGPTRLESVADHSWKVADAVLLLSDHFDWIDHCRALELALLHDKLELLTGDLSPIDAEGTGRTTHAFNVERAIEKKGTELAALERYADMLRPAARRRQSSMLRELILETSEEARFVKAVDKLASLVFVIQAKRGRLDRRHVEFTVAYSAKAVECFPALRTHHDVLVDVFLTSVKNPRSSYADRDTTEHCALR
jgi:5'-deoxynucleotidase YfbR-like HD superfamily hydrolase